MIIIRALFYKTKSKIFQLVVSKQAQGDLYVVRIKHLQHRQHTQHRQHKQHIHIYNIDNICSHIEKLD